MTDTHESRPGGPSHSNSTIRFARGFAVARQNTGVPAHWLSTPLGEYFVWVDPTVPTATAASGDRRVFFAGEPIDCDNDTMDIETIAGHAMKELAQSEAALDAYLYFMAGRYVLIYSLNGTTKVRADAVGTRTIFFSTAHTGLAASHAALVAAATGAKKRVHDFTRREEFKKGIRHFPGRTTPYDDVVYLTPNTRLHLNTLQVERYFPVTDLPARSCASAAELAARAMTQVIRLATKSHTVVQSLTAGLDSRVTLACSRPSKNAIRYFTFTRAKTPTQRLDADIAAQMANALGFNHVVIDRDDIEAKVSSEDVAEMRWNTFLGNANRLALAYRDALPGATLHIRSNVGETARAKFVQLYGNPDTVTPEFVARIWKTGMESDASAVQAFREFLQAIDFQHIHNYRPLDMFHWEHRTAIWHSMVLNETDVAFSTISAYNAHFILDYMFSAPMEERVNGNLFRAIINETWPELNQWPVNKPIARAAESRTHSSSTQSARTSWQHRVRNWFDELRGGKDKY